MFSDSCPTIENLNFAVIVAAPYFQTVGPPQNGIKLSPIRFNRRGAKFPPFDLLDGFPTFLVKANITNFHIVDYSMGRFHSFFILKG